MFSIVIPVYNEEKRIGEHLNEITSFFRNKDVELIFVDDGSTDGTRKLLMSQQETHGFVVEGYAENRGKGAAVRHGVSCAKGDRIVFFDIDLATPLVEFDRLQKQIAADDQVIIGSRRLRESRIEQSESRLRTFLGHGFTKLSNLLVPGVVDFTCGFKCFSKEAAQEIFSVARIDRWGFDTELLYIATLKNIPIRQIPVSWAHDTDSRVHVLRAVVSSLRELLQMKYNQMRGYYN